MFKPKFELYFLEDAMNFLEQQDEKTREKIIFNADKARYTNDPKLYKKLKDDIWELRTQYSGLQYRLLAFWDKTKPNKTLVIATHGIIKKTDKVPQKEIDKAIEMRKQYLSSVS